MVAINNRFSIVLPIYRIIVICSFINDVCDISFFVISKVTFNAMTSSILLLLILSLVVHFTHSLDLSPVVTWLKTQNVQHCVALFSDKNHTDGLLSQAEIPTMFVPINVSSPLNSDHVKIAQSSCAVSLVVMQSDSQLINFLHDFR